MTETAYKKKNFNIDTEAMGLAGPFLDGSGRGSGADPAFGSGSGATPFKTFYAFLPDFGFLACGMKIAPITD